MAAAIHASGEPAPLIWLDGEELLTHISSEPRDGRTTARYVLGLAGAYLAADPEGEFLDGPYGSLDDAANAIQAFAVTEQTQAINSKALSNVEVISRLHIFEWEPDGDDAIEVNGQAVSLREVCARQTGSSPKNV